MPTSRDESIDEVASEILDYLRDHPEAGDTLDGMVHWWIHRRRFQGLRELVDRALDRLVREGKLVRRVGADGTVIFAAVPDESDP